MDRVREGHATRADLTRMEELAGTVKACSRCGLGQTAGNPLLTTLRSLPAVFEAKLSSRPYEPVLRLGDALAAAEEMAGHKSRGKEARA
jgi:hypothetical protein